VVGVKYIPDGRGDGLPVLELTRRNLQTLLDKLDDPLSARTLGDGERNIWVRAVEDAEHYKTRRPGEVYMPSTGETR
jgi:hypothetical protein